MFLRLTLLAIVSSVILRQTAAACSCVSEPTRCDVSWQSGKVIFLGTVSALDNQNNSEFLQNRAVRFTSVDVLKGDLGSLEEKTIFTGRGGGDCGYPFTLGQRYLVYASLFQNQLTTSICSSTIPESMAGGVLRQLRAIRDGRRVDDLFGTVGKRPLGSGYEDLIHVEPLAGVTIYIAGEKGARLSTSTDKTGTYSFPLLQSDRYRIEVAIPPGLVSLTNRLNENTFVHVKESGVPGAGCRVDEFARQATTPR